MLGQDGACERSLQGVGGFELLSLEGFRSPCNEPVGNLRNMGGFSKIGDPNIVPEIVGSLSSRP